MENNAKLDILNTRFGRLVALEPRLRQSGERASVYWVCKCDCGTVKEVRRSHLTSGDTVSCGCLRRDLVNFVSSNKVNTHRLWKGMMERCYHESDSEYFRYGARGICVSPEWHDFRTFHRDMGNKPKGMTLDREDNDGPYSKENCRWATHNEQARNRRNTVFLEFDGKRMPLPAWADHLGIHAENLRARIALGWDVARALTEPFRTKKRTGS